jgi:hypothetical protein
LGEVYLSINALILGSCEADIDWLGVELLLAFSISSWLTKLSCWLSLETLFEVMKLDLNDCSVGEGGIYFF